MFNKQRDIFNDLAENDPAVLAQNIKIGFFQRLQGFPRRRNVNPSGSFIHRRQSHLSELPDRIWARNAALRRAPFVHARQKFLMAPDADQLADPGCWRAPRPAPLLARSFCHLYRDAFQVRQMPHLEPCDFAMVS
jgi:hypothetical protein